jgi:uncharacterized damage-inducible protein DinB
MNMNEIERIKDQLSRAFEGESWTGPSVMEVLKDIEPEKAASKPIPNAHSIWEILEHINSDIQNIIRRMRGDPTPMTDEEDWPKVTNTGKESWRDLMVRFKTSHNELLDEVSKLKPEQLDNPILEGLSSYYVTLHGVVQHNQYHLGQISILKKRYFSTQGMLSH